MLISSKDPSKIPAQRIVEMNQQLFMMYLSTEAAGVFGSDNQGPGPGGLDVSSSSPNNMETDPINGAPAPAPVTGPAANSNQLIAPPPSGGVNTGGGTGCKSWNGNVASAVSEIRLSPNRSLPTQMDSGNLDDSVWDWEPPPILMWTMWKNFHYPNLVKNL